VGHDVVLTLKTARGVSMNAHGHVEMADIDRWDLDGRPTETVLSRSRDVTEAAPGTEPPFHIHLNGWEKVAGVRLTATAAKYLAADFPGRLDFLDSDDQVLFWLYVGAEHQRALEAKLAVGQVLPF
jgi:hypothetical protein